MRRMMRRSILAAAASFVAAVFLTAAPAGAAGPGLTHYSVHADSVVTQTLDSTPCGAPGTVTFDQHMAAAVVATESGLTDDEVLALVQDDPDGVIRQITVTTTCTVVLATGGHTYTGKFTMWF